jgi:2-isopropylmalate synthase
METEHSMMLPRPLQIEFSQAIQHVTEDTGTEISPEEMWTVFEREYLTHDGGVEILSQETVTSGDRDSVTVQLLVDGRHKTIAGEGNGPISAFVSGLANGLGVQLDVLDYVEHAITAGAEAQAVAYVETRSADGRTRWGVGIDASILAASLKAVVSAINGTSRMK